MRIDINKKYKTRDGQDVEIRKIHPERLGCVEGVIKGVKERFFGHSVHSSIYWTFDGKPRELSSNLEFLVDRVSGESNLDLIEVIETEAKDTSAMIIDINKKYKTRDGQDVMIRRIHPGTSDFWDVMGYIGEKDGADLWTSEGKYDLERESDLDLIEVVETTTPPKSRKRDMVNNPIHYGTGDIECIDYIQDFLTEEEYIGYLRGNIAKYLHRWRYKNGLEDLKKSEWYGAKLIKLMENK